MLNLIVWQGAAADNPATGCAFTVFLTGINVVLLAADVKEIRRGLNAANAHREISTALWVLGGLLLMPAYLWRRANVSDRRYGPFAANLSILFVAICAILGVAAATG
jgi:hypothetical protein